MLVIPNVVQSEIVIVSDKSFAWKLESKCKSAVFFCRQIIVRRLRPLDFDLIIYR